MHVYRYTILLHPDPDEGGYTVTVPALPGVVTQGETLEEAIAMARNALGLHVAARRADGEPVPEERVHPQAITISVAARACSAPGVGSTSLRPRPRAPPPRGAGPDPD